ncbi:Chitin binding Peritrophin-A domain [Popillia japonica]|uniref:Chitin binding Peritrophin-A domain n=1 Tax=Popillia japonica TaxID=7064 RepID=A0AAW1JZY1_POPJA
MHPRNCSKFLLCTSDGRLLLGICNSNTYYDPNSKSCQNTPNCGHIQQQNQFGSSNQENWQANTQYQYFRLINIGNEAYTLGLDHNFCQNNPGVSIHPRNCAKFLAKFLLCTSDGRLLLGVCNANTYYDPNSKSCQNTPNCTHIQQQNQFGSSNQENWQANTQYQYFRLINIGNEAYTLGLDHNFCQNNPGVSIHPRNCAKFLLCTSDGRLLLGVCNANTYYDPNSKSCQNTPNCTHIQQQNQFGSSNQENWQANTQYQYFRLISIGYEAYALGLDQNFCQINPGFSIHPKTCSPKTCSKFLLCSSDGRLLLGICNANTYFQKLVPNSYYALQMEDYCWASAMLTPTITHQVKIVKARIYASKISNLEKIGKQIRNINTSD